MPIQAAERISRHTDRILKQWEERARKEVAVAGIQESLILRNSLPEFLRLVTETLLTSASKDEARDKADRVEGERIGKEHGWGRANILGYTLSQLMSEYHILRQVIFDVLEQEGAVNPVAREVIVSLIEQAVNNAGTQFSEALREAQERLSDALAHDLRGPITATKASSQLIIRHPDNETICIKMANRISADMDRLDLMIRDLLDASRIKAGQKLPLHLRVCDLASIAGQVAEEANLTHANRVRLSSRDSCRGYWDETGLRRILENLVTNAVKYGAPDTPITITIDQTNGTITLSVHNEGNPISPSDQINLFQPFRRRTPGRQTGWGLGLALVKGIVEAHHGTIQVESSEGKGTTLIIGLPRKLPD